MILRRAEPPALFCSFVLVRLDLRGLFVSEVDFSMSEVAHQSEVLN
jgi:hypothetical protein